MGEARCLLDDAVFSANARIWSVLSGGRLRPVLKSDGYGWGAAHLVGLLEETAESCCVVDASEFRSLRGRTTRPLTLLGFCRADEIEEILAAGALPNIATLAELEAACVYAQERHTPVRLRVGLSAALGWNGVAAECTAAFAARAAASPLIELELWTHLTSPTAHARELRAFDHFVTVFRTAGARIVSVETASSASLAAGVAASGGAVRVGIGLFGAHMHAFPALRCALRLEADVISRLPARPDLVAGYACAPLPPGAYAEVLRVGYGDGLPRGLAGCAIQLTDGEARIATIGMQHTVIAHDLSPAASRTLLHPQSNITELCAGSGTSAHELTVSLGLAHAP